MREVICKMYERYVRWWRNDIRAAEKIIVIACVAFQDMRFSKRNGERNV